MSKELTPLATLKDLREDAKHHLDHHIKYLNERLDIIETALNKVEKMKELIISEENTIQYLHDILRIIKEKRVNVNQFLKHCSSNNKWGYNKTVCDKKRHLTQEEYDLLKEVLL